MNEENNNDTKCKLKMIKIRKSVRIIYLLL